MALGIELIRVPEAYVTASFKRTNIDKTAGKTGTDERNTAMNASMRPDQKAMSAVYKMMAQIDQTHEVVKSILKPAPVKPTKVVSPRVNGVVERLQAQLAELNKKVQMLVANQPKSVFDGCFTRNPERSLVQKSVEPSIFSSAFAPRDLTEIAKAAEREGYWPLSIKHEGPGSVIVKSSSLCLGEHEEVKVPAQKSADTSIFTFARA